MRDALTHRGPDDAGIEIIGNVGLVHTRLSIIDLSASGHQPMTRPGSDWWLLYNGEIYNHLDLRDELTEATFLGESDTETLLWSLERWGIEVLSRLTGQFAFAALDLRGDRLLLVRDRWGIKPLYIARFDGGVWFASEPQALIAAGAQVTPVESAWNSVATGSYLGGESTLLGGITRLPVGTVAEISLADGEMVTRRWHDPSQHVDRTRAATLEHMPRARLTDEVERVLRHAVHRSLLSDATVGTLCSGGLDSSLITAFAVEHMPDIVAFGAGHRADGRADEGAAARRVAKALGIDAEIVEVTPQDFRRLFVAATVHSGGPIPNASAVTVAQLAERAKQCGVKVLLTGEGSDELFGGYEGMHAAEFAAFLPRHYGLVRLVEPMLLTNPRKALNPQWVLSRLWTTTLRAIHPRSVSSGWQGQLNADTRSMALADAVAAYAHHTGERRQLEADLLQRLDYSLCWLLNRMDMNVMQMSVEARVPFLEPEVAALVLNLPLEARVGPWSKGILRDVARRVLPWSVAHRPKIYGMAFNAAAWVEEGADPAFLRDGMLRDTLGIPRDGFDEVLRSSDESLRLRLWSAEVWCRSLFGGQSVGHIEQDLWVDEPASSYARESPRSRRVLNPVTG